MDLLPSLEILRSDGRVIVQQTLANLRVGLLDDAQIERRQSAGVFVVWRCAKLQQRAAHIRGKEIHHLCIALFQLAEIL